MLPNTLTVYDSNGLLKATSHYNKHGITEVVVKRDRKNGGIGIHRFKSVEDVYNQLSFGTLDCPVVLQPFIEKFKDIRVIWLGEYIEAYERINSTNFRHNLHCGGSARQFELTEELLEFCKKVMRRGCFPYAHIDLMQTPSEEFYLTEVNLRGGLRGAKINGNTYQKLIDSLHTKLLAEVHYGDGTPER